jgi:hypothetical protein
MATGRLPGQSPGLQVIRWSDAPTAGTTTLSGLDDYSVGLTYTAGYESVYLNGVLLDRGTDYTATNGTTIVLTNATVAGDIVNVFATQISPVNGSLPTSTYTTKGDILVATAANTPVRQGVGANDTVLTADSTAATGLKWAALPASTPAMQVPETTGNYLKTAAGTVATASTITAVVNRTEYTPVYLPTASFDRISIATGAGFSGTASVRLGLYNVSTTTGKPSTVVFDAGTVSCTAASTTYEITITQSITAGWYYLACNMQTAAATPTFLSFGNGLINGVIAGSSNFTNTNTGGYFRETGITGAFATAGTLTTTTDSIVTGMRLV